MERVLEKVIFISADNSILYSQFSQTASGKLSWSHYAKLLTVTDDLALGTPSATGVKQIQGMGFLALSEKGQIVTLTKDTIKGPYIFEFPGLLDEKIVKETALESKLIDFYPSIEEKAATQLYLIIKNHSFVDGNKRIAAVCFLLFLEK